MICWSLLNNVLRNIDKRHLKLVAINESGVHNKKFILYTLAGFLTGTNK